MESPRWWATFYCFIYLLLPDACILSQNVPSDIVSKQSFTPPGTNDKEFSNIESKPSSKAQFMNTLLALASNRALPDRTGPVVQTSISENPFTPNIRDEIPRTVNIVPVQPQTPSYVKESVKFSGQPSMISNSAPNMFYSSPTIPTSYVPVRPIQTTVTPEQISLSNYLTVPQVIPLQNYGYNIIQTPPTVYQIPQPVNDGYRYVTPKPQPYSEISPPPVNLQISPPSQILPEINTNCGIIEFTDAPNVGTVVQESTNLLNDYDAEGFPLNLQINLPSQSMPAPRITVVTAASQPVAEVKKEPEYPFLPFGGFPPPPPFIMRKSRSSWRKIWPIILLALFNDRGCNGGGGCSCCNCCSDSDNPIPIPYPIPIPINSPIINNSKSSCSSRKRGQRGRGGAKGTN